VDWVDAAKGMSILLVVAHHTLSFLASTGQAPGPLMEANTALASMRMPLFFLASGLFAAGPLAAPWRTLLHKRVAFFLYLYLLWTLIRFAFFLALPGAIDPYDSTDPVKLALTLLLPGSGTWFLYALALFAVIAKLIRHVPVWLQLGAAGVLSAVVGAELITFEHEPWMRIARYLFFFLLGCHAPELFHRLARSSSAVKGVVAAGACVVGAGGAVMLGARSIPGVAFALNILAVTFGILFAAWVARYRVGQPLVSLGRNTLQVYLIHILWLAVIVAGVQHLDLATPVAYALPVVITLVLTALSLLTHRVLVSVGATALFALPSPLAYRPPGRHRAPVAVRARPA
jgi:uncharacterized membrane protein YcfT